MPEPPYPLHPSIVDRVHPDFKAYYNEFLIDRQQIQYFPLEAVRAGAAGFAAGELSPVGETKDHTVSRAESTGPPITVRCYTPEETRPSEGWPTLISFHGGGWVLGNLDSESNIHTRICATAKCVVISVDYRLAPEHPFPAAVDDGWEAVQWTINSGKDLLNLDISKLAISGSSAGANIAASICQRAVTRGGTGFKLQVYLVPAFDNTADVSNNNTYREFEHSPSLSVEKMLWFRNQYLPNRADWSNVEASPLLWDGDWSKLPPACIVAGGLDILKGEAESFAERLNKEGVEASVRVFEAQPHVFPALDEVLEDAKEAITHICEMIKRFARA